MELRKEEDMRRLWLISLVLMGCSASSVNGYKEYTNVSYYYKEPFDYIVELDSGRKYTLDIDNVYYTKRYDTRIRNKFYVGVDKKLVIYVEW